MLREEASPAKVLEQNIVAKVADLDKPSKKKAKLSTASNKHSESFKLNRLTQPLKRLYGSVRASERVFW